MNFDDWLAKVKEFIDDIELLVQDCEQELADALKHIRPCAKEASSFSEEAGEAEGRSSPTARVNDTSSRLRQTIALLQHDVEVVIRRETLLRTAGIDLTRVFDPVFGDFGSRIEQSSAASLDHLSADPCAVATYGQGSLKVPLKLELLGSTSTGALHLNVSPKLRGPASQSLVIAISRMPSVCGDLGQQISLQVEERATASLLNTLGQVIVELPQLDFLPMAAAFSATWLDDALRIVGAHQPRRSRRPLLPSVQSGFDLALKIEQEVIWRVVRAEVSQLGAKLFSGPTVTGAKSFDLVAGMQESGSLRIGCDLVSWTVTVRLSLSFDLSIQGQRQLIITGRQVGTPSVDIDIRPSVVGWLFGDLKRLAENFIASNVPALGNIRQVFLVGSVRRLDAVFWNEFVVFSINA
jgi:hypothetical protein